MKKKFNISHSKHVMEAGAETELPNKGFPDSVYATTESLLRL